MPESIQIAPDINYVHADHLGAPQKMTDKDRVVVWDASFLPFGEEDSILGSAVNDNRFPGQRLSPETGLHYNYWRDYDPTTGRYLQSDPIGLAGGINTYGYVHGNPVNYVNPDGKIALETVVVVGGGAIIVGEAIRQHCLKTKCGQRMADSLQGLVDELNTLLNESSDDDQDEEVAQCPPLQDDLLGDNVKEGSGNRKVSDLPGGQEAADELFDKLTGGTGKPDPNNPDHSVGENGVRKRPGKPGQGPRVDIPAKNGKPHETIHFYE
ncbi:RHS repeat domain-containing protein [Sneathiella glossodoripedis]|uniref:RHS repeat domain-containing protein n=1 Tax=Sneathiella glossodoripedis TaxID=418853 RepID=UPI00131EEC19|nr:RHS repeat-associated core domain-containing protein [Sneathiella glossodoripedis]